MNDTSTRNVGHAAERGRSILLMDLPSILWRRKLQIGAATLLSLALGVAYLVQAERVYLATARILVEDKKVALPQDSVDSRDRNFVANQAEIIRSPLIFGSAIKSLASDSEASVSPLPIEEEVDELGVNPVPGTNVIVIDFRSPEAKLAVDVVEAVMNSYQVFARQTDHDASTEVLHWLTQHEEKLRGELHAAEEEYSAVREQSPLLGQGSEGLRVQHENLTSLAQRLVEAKDLRIEAETRLEALEVQVAAIADRPDVSLRPAAPQEFILGGPREADAGSRLTQTTANVATNQAGTADLLEPKEPIVQTGLAPEEHKTLRPAGLSTLEEMAKVRQQLWAAQVREREINQHYGPKHATTKAIRQQVAQWQGLLNDSLVSVRRSLERKLQAARGREQQLAALYQSEFETVKKLDLHQLKEQQAMEKFNRLQALHDAAFTRLSDWEFTDYTVAEGQAGVRIHILERPVLPEAPVWPRPVLLLALCVALGLVGGTTLVVLSESSVPSPVQGTGAKS